MASVTGVIYQSDCICIEHDLHRDYFSVVAQDDIPMGTLVLLEYPISGDEKTLMGALIVDPILKKELHPRHDPDDIATKVMTNLFQFEKLIGVALLGRVMSKFNHSCTPNCHMAMADFCNYQKVYGVWVHRPIKKGQELTVDYHDKYILDNMNISNAFRERDLTFIQDIVDDYFESKAGRMVTEAQHDARNVAKKIR